MGPALSCSARAALCSMMLLLLAMPERAAGEDAAAGGDAAAATGAPFQITLNGGCANATVAFYLKHYYNHTDPDAVPLPASCAYQANETLPASFFAAGGGGGAGPNVTVGTCIRWPGAVEPGSTTVGPSSTIPVWHVSAALTDGRGLRYGGPGEQFWDPLGRPCAGPDAPNCLSFARVEGEGLATLTCEPQQLMPLPGGPPLGTAPPGATPYALSLLNSCADSAMMVAAKWYYADGAVPPPEGSPACRSRGADVAGTFCVAHWQGVFPGNDSAIATTSIPIWYFSAFMADNTNAYWGVDVFWDLLSRPCPGFDASGCLRWTRVNERLRLDTGRPIPLTCTQNQEPPAPPPPPPRPSPAPASPAASPAPARDDTAAPPAEGRDGVAAPPAPAPDSPAASPGPAPDSLAASPGPAPDSLAASPGPAPDSLAASEVLTSGGGSVGVVIGAVMGSVGTLAAAAAVLLVLRRRRRRSATLLDEAAKGGALEQGDSVEADWLEESPKEASPLAEDLLRDDALLSHVASRARGAPARTHAAPPPASLASGRSVGAASRRSVLSNGEGLEGLPPSAVVQFGELRFEQRIGEGSYGRVYLAMWRETQVAVKILLSGGGGADASDWERALALDDVMLGRLKEEARIMMALRHTNVLQIFGVCTDPPGIVSEFCARGSLTDVLRAARQRPADLPWRRRLHLALGAARGMLILHASTPPIVHRDLKSPNLLVDAHWVVKVSDFNLSRILEDAAHSQSSQAAMNPRWLAPEVMRGGAATPAADVFSFGVVLWELLTWQLPWTEMGGNAWHIVGAVMAGRRLDIPPREELPGEDTAVFQGLDAYVALLQRCWAQAPEERPDFQQVARELRDLLAAQDAAEGRYAHSVASTRRSAGSGSRS